MPYSAAAVSAEDLALPQKELQKLAANSALPLLASNLYLKNNKKPDFLVSTRLAEAGGRKVGFFSLVIHDPAKANTPKYLPNYRLEKESYETERAVRALRAAGAQLVVGLVAIAPGKEAPHEFYKDYLARLPRIDLLITDEPSLKKPFKAKRTWVAPAGQGMQHAARLGLALDDSGRVKGLNWERLPLDAEKYGEDAALLKVLARHKAAAAAHFGRKIGTLKEALPLAEAGTYPAADFAADCMRRWARSNAAIIGLSEPAAGFSSGTVTVGDLHRAFPLDSSVVFVKIRGDDLERALTGLSPTEISVSGLKLFLRDSALERAESETGPLVPGRVYHLAVPDSLVSGRDNPVLSSAMEFANSRRPLREVISWCFSLRSSFAKPAGGRVIKAEK
ncbi:MAG: hypothetical protein CVU79_12090 [Elusimicrobia bacterium HGW-Elusimicrobia-3]|nr:MAG: hypothetical protein CVU79_12090 [Elusimicrobia bacterium HGW-Elusimicrobia-3]